MSLPEILNAPNSIFVNVNERRDSCENCSAIKFMDDDIEYIRADIVDALREQLLDARLKITELEEKL